MDAIVDEELQELKKDPRYNLREYYDVSRSYTSLNYIKSLGPFGQYIYACIVIAILSVFGISIYIIFKGTPEVKTQISIALVLMLLTYIVSLFVVPK